MVERSLRVDFVVQEWPRLQAKWEAWADAATDADIAGQVPFKSRFVGDAGLPAWQIVMHVAVENRDRVAY